MILGRVTTKTPSRSLAKTLSTPTFAGSPRVPSFTSRSNTPTSWAHSSTTGALFSSHQLPVCTPHQLREGSSVPHHIRTDVGFLRTWDGDVDQELVRGIEYVDRWHESNVLIPRLPAIVHLIQANP